MACGCQRQALTIGGVDGGECDAPIKFPWPSDVDGLKARVAAEVQALDIGVSSCSSLGADDRSAWDAFLAEWVPFAQKKTPLIGSYGDWVTACAYAHMVDAWRSKFASVCGHVPGPDPIRGADMSTLGSIKWVSAAVIAAAAVAVVGGGYFAWKFR